MKLNFKIRWLKFWLKFATFNRRGRIATRIASIFAPYYKDAFLIAFLYDTGYVSPKACLSVTDIQFGKNVFIDDRVTIFKHKGGGAIILGDQVAILRDTILDSEQGGTIKIGNRTWIHQKCNLSAAVSGIIIGEDTMIASDCSFYPHNHSIEIGIPISKQPLYSKGPIVVGDHAWIGTRVTVLGGVTIGDGAIIGAGSVVTKNIPDNCVAFGVPAQFSNVRRSRKKTNL